MVGIGLNGEADGIPALEPGNHPMTQHNKAPAGTENRYPAGEALARPRRQNPRKIDPNALVAALFTEKMGLHFLSY